MDLEEQCFDDFQHFHYLVYHWSRDYNILCRYAFRPPKYIFKVVLNPE